MAISPNQQEKLALEIRRLYADAEKDILEKIAKRIEKGIDKSGWREKKLTELRKARAEIEAIIASLRKVAPEKLQEIIEKAYEEGVKSADSDLKVVADTQEDVEGTNITLTQQQAVAGALTGVNKEAVAALVASTERILENAHLQILRHSNDAYRGVIAEAAGYGVTGTKTRRETAQYALNRLADKGIGAFQDKSGRKWDIASYTEMATRSVIGQASIQGHVDRMTSQGRDLVIVSDHPEECGVCRPWEGEILSVSGASSEYRSLREARGSGLFHPGCGHRLHTYIEGLTRPPTPEADPEGYYIRQKQRYIERRIRQWKRRESVAITEKDKKKAHQKVRQWQAKQREFIEEHDRRRKYEREQINKAR